MDALYFIDKYQSVCAVQQGPLHGGADVTLILSLIVNCCVVAVNTY